jgi:hypothetical protein
MAPSKASAQSRAVIAAMTETAAETSAALKKLEASLDLLHGAVASVDSRTQQMRSQLDLQAAAIADSTDKHKDTAKILHALMVRLKIPDPDPGEDEADKELDHGSEREPADRGKAKQIWPGNTPGTSTSTAGAALPGDGGGVDAGGGVGVGGGRPDSTDWEGFLEGGGGGGHGGAGGGRNHPSGHENGGHTHMPKMSFPRFFGEHPRIWRDQCLDYFRVFNISPALWHTTATLHLDGNAAIWYQAYKQRHTVRGWPQLITAVENEFGVDDQRKSMKALLKPKQTRTVHEYITKF